MLQDLELGGFCSIARTGLVRLTARDRRNTSHTLLLPRLIKLGLTQVGGVFGYDAFADMVESRWRLDNLTESQMGDPQTQVARIQTIRISINRERANMDLITVARFLQFSE
jgi:hypothetical protein